MKRTRWHHTDGYRVSYRMLADGTLLIQRRDHAVADELDVTRVLRALGLPVPGARELRLRLRVTARGSVFELSDIRGSPPLS